MNPIERQPLRDRVYEHLRAGLASGAWTPGSRLSDNAIAEELDISRTPVRESLLRLEAEGFLVADHHRGFFVPELRSADVRQIYPILWTLERLALELASRENPSSSARLRDLSESFRGADDPVRGLEADRAFHEALTGGITNDRLLTMLEALRTSLVRYELAFMSSASDRDVSAREHDRIVDALETGDPGAAGDILVRHWRRGMEILLDHISD